MFSPRRTTISGRKVKESEIDEFVRLCKSCDFEMSVNRCKVENEVGKYEVKVEQRRDNVVIKSWVVWRRYNDFDQLNNILESRVEFPPRTMFGRTGTVIYVMEERRQGFNKWISTVHDAMKTLTPDTSKKKKELLWLFLWKDRTDIRTTTFKNQEEKEEEKTFVLDLPPGIERTNNEQRKIEELENRLKRMSGQLETAHKDLKIRTERERKREEEEIMNLTTFSHEEEEEEDDDDEGTIDSLNEEVLRLSGLVQGNKNRLSAEAVSARDRAEDAEKMYKEMLKHLREEMEREKKKWAAEKRRLTLSLQEAKTEIITSKVRRHSSMKDLIKERDILLNTPKVSRRDRSESTGEQRREIMKGYSEEFKRMTDELATEKAKNASLDHQIKDLQDTVFELEKQRDNNLKSVKFALGEDEKQRGLKMGHVKLLDVDDVAPQQTIALLLERFAETSADLKREEQRKRLAEKNRDAMEKSLRKIKKTLASLTQENMILQVQCDDVKRDRSESQSQLKKESKNVHRLEQDNKALRLKCNELKRDIEESRVTYEKYVHQLQAEFGEKSREVQHLALQNKTFRLECDELKRGNKESNLTSGKRLRELRVEFEGQNKALRSKCDKLKEENEALQSKCDRLEGSNIKSGEKINELEEENKALELKCDELKRGNKESNLTSGKRLRELRVEFEGQNKALRSKCDKLKEENEALQSKYDRLEGSNIESGEKINELEEKNKALELKCDELIKSHFYELKRHNMILRSESQQQLAQEREKAKRKLDENNMEMRKQLEGERERIYAEARKDLKREKRKIEMKRKKLQELLDNQKKAMEMVAMADKLAKEEVDSLREKNITEHKSEFEALKSSAMTLKRNLATISSSSEEQNELSNKMNALLSSTQGTKNSLSSQTQDAKDKAAEATEDFVENVDKNDNVFEYASKAFKNMGLTTTTDSSSSALHLRLCEIRIDILNAFEANATL